MDLKKLHLIGVKQNSCLIDQSIKNTLQDLSMKELFANQLRLNKFRNNNYLVIFGTLFGLILGVLPGLGPTTGGALILPFTMTLDPLSASLSRLGSCRHSAPHPHGKTPWPLGRPHQCPQCH